MISRDAQLHVAKHFAIFPHTERRRAAQIADIAGGVVGIVPAIGNRIRPASTNFARDFILGAIHELAARLVRELAEDFTDVIEVAVRRTISAWAEAVDGADDALLDIASPEIAEELLRPNGPKTRLVIRGPKMAKATVSKLAAKDPIKIAIDAKVTGVRYIEDRDTVSVVAGAKDRETTFIQRFILQLDDDPARPWKLVAAGEMPR